MTIADEIQTRVNNVVDSEGRVVSLTEIFGWAKPERIESRAMDEIAFIYSDGSSYLTAVMTPEESAELQTLQVGARDPSLFNQAADYVINLEIRDAGVVLPEGSLLDERFRGMTVDEVYNVLSREQKVNSYV